MPRYPNTWTSCQTTALKQFVEQEEAAAVAAGETLPTCAELARRAADHWKDSKGLAAVYSKSAIKNKIDRMRRAETEEARTQLLPPNAWTRGQIDALKQFIRQQEEDAVAAGQESPTNVQLARAVMAQQVSVGSRTESAITQRIRKVRGNRPAAAVWRQVRFDHSIISPAGVMLVFRQETRLRLPQR